MPAALAGAMAAAKAAIPGARTAAAHAREGQATTARSKKWIGAASRRSAQAALEASSRQVEASGGPVCPLTPIGGRTGGRCNNREAFSPLRYWALNFTAEPLAAPRRTASACSTDVGPSSCSSRVDGQRRCWMAGRVMTWTEAGAGGRRERRSGACGGRRRQRRLRLQGRWRRYDLAGLRASRVVARVAEEEWSARAETLRGGAAGGAFALRRRRRWGEAPPMLTGGGHVGVGWYAGGAWPGWPWAAAHPELPHYYPLRALPLLASYSYYLLSPLPASLVDTWPTPT